ncbi:unnamed protein product [Adineta ricciae]|uniref:S-adenosyl-L-homocysteine hydrolase NAD binding domain-containing protein n=1 Tax=Adineta ricciae TaxID=249248 RepID=A0A814X7D1_ADIRI|nr:unnamed protein product [Adineta ricciae]CAF1215425.1 unnamed protein product [Adineta ricciae]
MHSSNAIRLLNRRLFRNCYSKRFVHPAWPTLEREIKNGRQSLDILFIVTSHNTMSQKALCLLSSTLQCRVMVELHSNEKLVERVQMHKPDLIICPFLTRSIPNQIYRDYITLIVHPGPVGDRGRHSVDRWVLERPKEWGVTILEAVEEMDAGPVWAEEKLDTEQHLPQTATKGDAYNILTTLAMKGLREIYHKIFLGHYPGVEQPASVKSLPLNTLKQRDCAIDWSSDSASTIARKIQSRDSQPGLLDSLCNIPLYLFGAHVQPLNKSIHTPPKTILAKDKNAFLLSCADSTSALWITHLKNALDKKNPFKLPAAQVLPSTPTLLQNYLSFEDIHVDVEDDVCYVQWDFYNGAMRDDHCYRLKQAIRQNINASVKVVVLLGGLRYFSNGIDLNTIEASDNPVEQSQKYIHAINDLIRYLMMDLSDKIIVSVLRGHAGAGGAMMPLVGDFIFIHENSIINAHYRTMGLFGSEYWTFNLPSRLGSVAQANSLVNHLQPMNAQQAVTSGFADFTYSAWNEVQEKITNDILPNLSEHLKWKAHKRQENITKFGHPEACRHREIKIMNDNFASFEYNRARYQFVRKIPANTTPFHLLSVGSKQATMMKGQTCAAHIYNEIKSKYEPNDRNVPALGCLLAGSKPESELYVRMKEKSLREKVNFKTHIVQLQPGENDNLFGLKLERVIREWNADPNIHGILVQLPFPEHLKQYQSGVLKLIHPEKDIDGLLYPNSSFVPCAAQAIIWLLDWYDVKLNGKNVVVVGSSKLVGEPVSLLCKARGATVTICSIHTQDLREAFSHADIIITATGSPHLIHGDLLPENRSLVIVDAGVSHDPPHIRGDVHMDSVRDKCILITPPVGAVGPVTIAALAHNLFQAYLAQEKLSSGNHLEHTHTNTLQYMI